MTEMFPRSRARIAAELARAGYRQDEDGEFVYTTQRDADRREGFICGLGAAIDLLNAHADNRVGDAAYVLRVAVAALEKLRQS